MGERAGVTVAAVVAVLVGLSACTGGDEPGPGPTTSVETLAPTPTPTPTPSAVLPTLPPEAMTQDAAGAQAFVRFWFDTLNYGYMSGSSDALRAVSAEACAECADFYELIDGLAAQGDTATGPALVIDAMTSGPPDGDRAMVILTYTEVGVTLVNESGETRALDPGESTDAGAIANWNGTGWIMSGIGSA